MDARTINDKLYKSVADMIQVYPVNNLRASNIGHPCERYLYLQLTNWEDIKPHDAGLQSIFNLGNTLEDFTIENIKRAGFEVITPTYRSFRVEVKGGYISGREDIRIKDENGYLLPVEIKGLSPFVYDKLNCVDDFLNHPASHVRGYPAQLLIYMLHFGKDKGFFALTNKLSGETKFIDVDLDYDLAESYLSKAERIYEAVEKKELPPACDDIRVCERCNLAHICGNQKRQETDIEIDGELDSLINRKNELADAKREYEQVDKQIKAIVGNREKILTGEYLIERSTYIRKAFTVEEKEQSRIKIRRL